MPELDLGNVMGPGGKSAYQTAIDAGYSGSEEAFNAALVAVPGHIADTDIHVTAAQKDAWNSTVRYDAAQSLTDAQKTQARGNIGSASSTELEEISTALTEKPNPNLLDNWYFGNLVNQRGKTSYSHSGDYEYSVDRWKSASTMTCSVESDCVLITINRGGGLFMTLLEKPEQYAGKTLTISALLKGPESSKCRFYYKDGSTVIVSSEYPVGSTKTLISYTFTINTALNIPSIYPSYLMGADEFRLYAAKLELGSQQTLAHQDANGDWVLNEIPDYGEQLARCQRYFQTFKTQSLRPTDYRDFRPVMRTNPVLSTITVGSDTLYTASADL